jgi:rRNA maturation endonuclease Nob1
MRFHFHKLWLYSEDVEEMRLWFYGCTRCKKKYPVMTEIFWG